MTSKMGHRPLVIYTDHEERVKSLNKCDTSSTLRCFLLRRVRLRFRVAHTGPHIRPYFALPRKITNYVSESLIPRSFELATMIDSFFDYFLCFPRIQCCRKQLVKVLKIDEKKISQFFVNGKLLSRVGFECEKYHVEIIE